MSIWGWVKSTNPAVNKAAAKSNTTEFIGSHKHLNYVFVVLHSCVPLCSNQRFLVLKGYQCIDRQNVHFECCSLQTFGWEKNGSNLEKCYVYFSVAFFHLK